MAAEIDLSNGTPAMAFIGNRKDIWHGLGQELQINSPIEVWIKEAGFDWDIIESDVKFQNEGEELLFTGKKVLSRSDNKIPLAIVSDAYKTVQPKQVLEFFRDIVSDSGMHLSTAGCLFDGKKFWALANTGNSLILNTGDKIDGHLLLSSSCDGTNATTASFVSTRVVCNNTLNVALNEDIGKHRVKVTHRQVFDATKIKQKLGLIDDAWDKFKDNIISLTNFKVSDSDAHKFISDIIKQEFTPTHAEVLEINRVYSLYAGAGKGSDACRNTAFGILNAFTEKVDHYSNGHSNSSKFWNAAYGSGAKMKDNAFTQLLQLAA